MSPSSTATGAGVANNISVVDGQFGDTTFTKVFVGGLAWETKKETMNKYFEQFGDILEAVVIADKATGRSKGYGFVTFCQPDAATRACVDAAPVIDGRRANCNLASLGVQRSKPSTPKHGGGRKFMVMSPLQTGFGATTTGFSAQYAIQQGIPSAYNLYGYYPYSADYPYPTSYCNVYGGGASQYPIYAPTSGGVMSAAAAPFYPSYLNIGGYPHPYGAATQSAGMTMAVHSPIPHH